MLKLWAFHEPINDDSCLWEVKFLSYSYEECVAWSKKHGIRKDGIIRGEVYKPSESLLNTLRDQAPALFPSLDEKVENLVFALKQARNELRGKLETHKSMNKSVKASMDYALEKICSVIKDLA